MSLEDHDEQNPLQSLIAEILAAETRGESVDRDAIIGKHPDLAESMRDFFANHDRMNAVAGQEESTVPRYGRGLDDPTIPPTEGAAQLAEPTVGEVKHAHRVMASNDKIPIRNPCCPNCGSQGYTNSRPGSYRQLVFDRICSDCRTRYTPPTPRWVSVLSTVLGSFVCAAGVSGFIVLFGERLSLAYAFVALIGGKGIAVGVRDLMTGMDQRTSSPP